MRPPARPPSCSWIAAGRGHLEIARMCIEHGADVKRTEENGTPPLMIACRYGHADTVALLLEVRCAAMGCWSCDRGLPGCTPAGQLVITLPAAGRCLSSTPICLALFAPPRCPPSLRAPSLQHGADVHAIDSHGRNALIYGAGSGSASIVSALLQRGVDVNHTDVNGACPLILATNGQQCHLVAPLLVRGRRGSNFCHAQPATAGAALLCHFLPHQHTNACCAGRGSGPQLPRHMGLQRPLLCCGRW